MPTVIQPMTASGSLVVQPRPLAQPVQSTGPGAVVLKADQQGPLQAGVGSKIDMSA